MFGALHDTEQNTSSSGHVQFHISQYHGCYFNWVHAILIEDIRVIIITLAFLYISVILFVVIFVSFLMIDNHLHKRSLIKCLGGSL